MKTNGTLSEFEKRNKPQRRLLFLAIYIALVLLLGWIFQLTWAVTIVAVAVPALVILIGLALGSRRGDPGWPQFNRVGAASSLEAEVAFTSEQIQETIRRNVDANRRFTLVESSSTLIKVRIGVGPVTWGEDAEIRMARIGTRTRIDAQCQHRLATTVVDFGQSKRDLKKLMAGIVGP